MRTPPVLMMALLSATVACGQFNFGSLSKNLDTIKDVGKVAKSAAKIGPEEERKIGDSVAMQIVAKYGGVVRDDAMLRRVNLVGRAVARFSARPDAEWRFAVLNSNSINAFSAPDGYVFITRGLYDLADSDDALAGILGHEIAHVTKRHALSIVERGEFISGMTGIATRQSGDVRQIQAQLQQFDLGMDKILNILFEKGFDPQTEFEADKEGRTMAVTSGYASGGLRSVLAMLDKRGGDSSQVFSTHPPLRDRMKRLPN